MGQGQVNVFGAPLVRTYQPEEYQGTPENFSAVQSASGLMYFANNGYILEFDGSTWRKIFVDPDWVVSSLAIDSLGTIYASAGSQFGYLAPDRFGRLEYHSLSDGLNLADPQVDGVGKVFAVGGGVYFQTSRTVVHYPSLPVLSGQVRETNVALVPTETLFTNIYAVGGRIFVHERDKGLSELVEGKLVPLIRGVNFIERETVAMLPFKSHQHILCTAEEGMFYYTDKIGFGHFHTESNDFDDFFALQATALPDAYVLSTINRGTIVITKEMVNQKRRVMESYGREAGLPSEQINHIYNNQQYDPRLLWLSSQYGISRTRIYSPLRKVNEANAVKDVILDLHRFKGQMFVRTLGEIYFAKDTLQSFAFERVRHIRDNVGWFEMRMTREEQVKVGRRMQTRLVAGDYMVAGTRQGLWAFDGQGVAEQVKMDYQRRDDRVVATNAYYEPYEVSAVLRSQARPGWVFVGLKDGLALLVHQNGKWFDYGRLPEIDQPVNDLAEDSLGNLWMSFHNQGAKAIEFARLGQMKFGRARNDSIAFEVPDSLVVRDYGPANNLPPMLADGLLSLEGRLVFSTLRGLFRLGADGMFEPEDAFGLDERTRVLGLFEDGKGEVWLTARDAFRTELFHYVRTAEGRYELDEQSLRSLPEMTVQAVHPDNDSIIWISGTAGLFTYNNQKKRETPKFFNTLIRKVTFGADSVLFWGTAYHGQALAYAQVAGQRPELQHKQNSIKFEFAAPFFDNEDKLEYSFRLEGYNADWSPWTPETQVQFTNLDKGDYRFLVKARNIYGDQSTVATYDFHILTPWYEQWWFYVAEVGSFLLLLLLAIVLNRKRKANMLTSILTMVTVTAIFKLLGALVLGPIVRRVTGQIFFFQILGDTIVGALLFPTWSILTRLIEKGTIKEQKAQADAKAAELEKS